MKIPRADGAKELVSITQGEKVDKRNFLGLLITLLDLAIKKALQDEKPDTLVCYFALSTFFSGTFLLPKKNVLFLVCLSAM